MYIKTAKGVVSFRRNLVRRNSDSQTLKRGPRCALLSWMRPKIRHCRFTPPPPLVSPGQCLEYRRQCLWMVRTPYLVLVVERVWKVTRECHLVGPGSIPGHTLAMDKVTLRQGAVHNTSVFPSHYQSTISPYSFIHSFIHSFISDS